MSEEELDPVAAFLAKGGKIKKVGDTDPRGRAGTLLGIEVPERNDGSAKGVFLHVRLHDIDKASYVATNLGIAEGLEIGQDYFFPLSPTKNTTFKRKDVVHRLHRKPNLIDSSKMPQPEGFD